MLSLLLLLTHSPICTPSLAAITAPAVKEFKSNKLTIKSIVPESWQAIPQNITVPLSLLSKKGAQGKRAVIEVVPYDREDKNNQFAKAERDTANYYRQKEIWLDAYQGASIAYLPLKEKMEGGYKITSIGIKYKNLFGEFQDQSFYISTRNNKIFYVKALVPLDLLEQERANVDKVIETIAENN